MINKVLSWIGIVGCLVAWVAVLIGLVVGETAPSVGIYIRAVVVTVFVLPWALRILKREHVREYCARMGLEMPKVEKAEKFNNISQSQLDKERRTLERERAELLGQTKIRD